MEKCMKKYIMWLSTVLLISVVLAMPLNAAEETPVLKVAFPESKGINEVYDDGTYGGAVYDWLQEIAKYTGWKYEFITGEDGDLLAGMMAGEYDLMGGMFFMPGFEDFFSYPKYMMGSNYAVLLYRKGDTEIKGFDNTTLNGKRIGVYKRAASKIERLVKYLEFNKIQCEIVYYEDTEHYEQCLETGEVDLMLASDVFMKDKYNVAVKFEGDPYYIVTAKEHTELCEQLSDAMEAIYSANPNYADELYLKYFSGQYVNSISLTDEEREFITGYGPVKVAVVKDEYPLFYEQEDHVYTGVIPKALKLITDRTGLTFEYVYGDSYHDLIDMVTEGKADIIGGFMNDDYSAASMNLVRTSNYAFLDSVVLKNKNYMSSGEGFVMAVPYGKDYKTNGKSDTIKYYKDYLECLHAVNDSEADYTRLPAAYIESLYTRDNFANLSLVADTNLQDELTIAVPVPVNVPLYSVLNKAVNNLSEDELMYIRTQNTLTMREPTLTFRALLYSNPVMVIGVCVGFVLLLSAVVILITVYRTKAKVMKINLEKAMETSKAKSDFLSRMSHEIRTPMNGIIGMATIAMQYTGDSEKSEDCLKKILTSSKHLLSLINDILDMSKIESGKVEFRMEAFDFKNFMEDICDIYYGQARNRGVSFNTILIGMVDETLVGDSLRLNQILGNLLSNACKFTPSGGKVVLKVSQRFKDEEKIWLHFEVSDTGCGIASDHLDHIFESFEQGGSEITVNYGGTGLGLSIVKQFVEAMGGSVFVESEFGAGSTFTVDLPFGNPGREKSGYTCEGLKVLVMANDDNVRGRVNKMLEDMEADIHLTVNLEEALSSIRQAGADNKYDICLVDDNLSQTDMLESVVRLKEAVKDDTAILFLTASRLPELHKEAINAGAASVIAKPLFFSKLAEAIDSLHGVHSQILSQPELLKTYDFSGRKVLLAEDNELNREIAMEILSGAGVAVETANDGQEAVEQFAASPLHGYDLILMDIQMPRMDGYEAVRIIRSMDREDAKSIPIFAMTANAFADDVKKCLEAGMNYHLSKPIDIHDVFQKLNSVLGNHTDGYLDKNLKKSDEK